MSISKFINPITKFGAKVGFKLKSASPEILIGLGIAGIVGTIILACKETPKALDILEEHKDMMERIKEVHDKPDLFVEKYDEKDYRKDIFIQYTNTFWKLTKTYAPSAGLMVLSIAAILYSHGIMSKRNLELIAAYRTLQESFSTYKRRVKERFGDQADFNASFIDRYTGEEREVIKEDGTKEKQKRVDISTYASPYARFFDETNVNWEKDRSMNLFFLQAQQKFANEKLQAQGFLFLNDVYEALGFQKTSYGQLVGWYLGGDGDDFVDFGIFDGENEKKRDFVNGLEPAVLIDPNVDGVIYDLI